MSASDSGSGGSSGEESDVEYNSDGVPMQEKVIKITTLQPDGDCGRLLEYLMGHKWAYPFNQPVKWKKGGPLADYPRCVKQPRDLGTIKQWLREGYYQDKASFAKDVRLVWKGALAYHWNHRDEDIHKMAHKLSEIFEERMKDLMKSEPEARYVTHKFPVPQSVSKRKKRRTEQNKRLEQAQQQQLHQLQMQQLQLQQLQQMQKQQSHHQENSEKNSSRSPSWPEQILEEERRKTSRRHVKKRHPDYEELEASSAEEGEIPEKSSDGQPPPKKSRVDDPDSPVVQATLVDHSDENDSKQFWDASPPPDREPSPKPSEERQIAKNGASHAQDESLDSLDDQDLHQFY